MTRKDYKLIAASLRELGEAGVHCFDSSEDRVAIARSFSDNLRVGSPNFDIKKFVLAATLPGDTGE